MPNLISNQGMAKTNVIFKDLKDAAIVITIMSLSNSLLWPLQKSEGSWKMAVNYSKINQVVVLIAATVPVVAFFLEHINMFSGTWYVATDLVSVCLFLPYQKGKSDFIFA